MTLEETLEKIHPADKTAMEAALAHWNNIAMPLHSLGRLQDTVVRIAGMTGNARVDLKKKALVVMCADNGVVEEGVTQSGQEVTKIVAENFLKEKATASILCKKAGADISFVGNPLMDNVKASMSREMAAEFFGIDLKEDNILLLPGSRKQEIANLLEPMLQAAQLIKKERPEIKFFLPVATGIDKKYLEEKINEYGLTVKLCETKTYDLMNCCDFAIATSGTVTLEAALMGLPSIVLYKMSAITYRIAKIFVKIKYFSLPNILVDKQVLPELLQDEVNGENIARLARDLYKDTESAKRVKEELLMVKEKLGSPGVADKTAELILQTADRFKNEIKG